MTTSATRSRSTLVLLASALVGLSGVLAAAPAQAAPAGYHQIENKERPWLSGPVCLDIDGGSKNTGALAGVEWCSHNSLQQQWAGVSKGNGYYQLKNYNSGLCLEVKGAQNTDGAKVVQDWCSSDEHQQWRFAEKSKANGKTYYEVIARHSGKCLDKSGWDVVQWNCHGGDWQQWSKPF